MPTSSPEPLDGSLDGALPSQVRIPPSLRRAAMLEHPTLAVASVHLGRIRKINDAWHALFALPPDVSVESHVATLFPNSSNVDRFERQLKSEFAAARHGTLAARSEQLLVRRDGSAFLCEVVVWLLDLDDVDRPLNGDAIWQVRDITVERALRRELRDLGDYHRELSQLQPGFTLVIDRKGRMSYASASVEAVLGYPASALLGEPFTSLLDAADAHAAERWMRAATRLSATDDEHAMRLIDREGVVRAFACRAVDRFGSSTIAGLVVHALELGGSSRTQAPRDVSAAGAARLRQTLLASARTDLLDDASIASLLETVRAGLDGSSAVCWVRDVGDTEWVVRAASIGGPDDSSGSAALPPLGCGDDLLRIVDDVHPAADTERVEAALASGAVAVVEVPMHVDGTLVGWLAVGTSLPRRWLDAEIDFVIGHAVIVARALRPSPTPGVAAEEVPQARRAGLDILTGLPGRAAAERHLADSLSTPDAALVIFAVDLDHLQDVNESVGSVAGDTVLVRTAEVLVDLAGTEGFVARVDGDEFMVVVPSAGVQDVALLAQCMLDGISEVGSDDAIRTQIEASVGVCRSPQDGMDGPSLWAQAGLALREARARGRGQAFVFNQKLAASLTQRKALDAEIDEALRRDEFTIFYQPQLSFSTGLVVGFEALLRWRHPTRGLLLPDAFIQAAFQRGLVDVLTKLVLTQVCERIASWRRASPPMELPVSVNVSGRQFHDRRLPALVASALLKSGLPARLLILEITEQSLGGDDNGIERVVLELSRLGVRIAIGDFNLGHASFRYLRQVRVSQIKLGSHFVRGLPDNAEDAVLVAAVVDLAHRLKYDVVAEGVETRAQFERLRAMGCESGQGFYLGAPLAADAIANYLSSNREKPVH